MTFNPLPFVNPLQGTNSQGNFSRGNTLPLVALPWGLTHWTLQNGTDRWFFNPNTHRLDGLRATHQPSPWMGDYGWFAVMAQSGPLVVAPSERAVAYRSEDLSVHPDYVSVILQDGGTKLEMSPTERCAIFRFTYPQGAPARVLIDGLVGVEIQNEKNLIVGRSIATHGGAPEGFACYIAAQFDRPFTDASLISEGGENIGAVAEIDAATPVTVKIGTSFISSEQAARNIDLEIGAKDFDAVHHEASAIWSEKLGRIQIEGATADQQRTFYSCLYRSYLFPRMFHEVDAEGQTVHYSAYTGDVLPGVMYTDSGFWDTYRTLFPLLSILEPTRYGEILQGFVNAYKEGGWLPQWPSPGYRAVMIGTHIDVVFGDAFVKGITGFDRETAYEGLLRDANVPGDPHDLYGRVGLEDYLKLGYVAAETANKSASRSLDYHYDDFCISQVAGVLGRHADQETLRARALNYVKLYDAESDFVRGRNADGTWPENFDPYSWGGPYVEGSAWQSTWAVPHDPAGLIALMGGQEAFVRKLDQMMYQSPKFEVGSYGHEIHEMSEMAAVQFGQYAQSNQPVHLALFLYTAAGSPARTQYWARRTMDELYTPDDLPGDEDNGEMAAWYVFNALGFYPLCPGQPTYVFGAPLFPKATVTMEDGKQFTIEAPDNSSENRYANGVELNGAAHSALSISHQDIVAGGALRVTMGARPVERAIAAEDLPYALSAYSGIAAQSDPVGATAKISCGGGASGAFADDCYVTGGSASSSNGAIETGGVANAAPAAVYQSARQGTFHYDLPMPAPAEGRSYTVRLHFAETASESQRLLNVGINSEVLLSDWDLRAEGGLNRAVVKEYAGILPDAEGIVRIDVAASLESPNKNGTLCAIEILPA